MKADREINTDTLLKFAPVQSNSPLHPLATKSPGLGSFTPNAFSQLGGLPLDIWKLIGLATANIRLACRIAQLGKRFNWFRTEECFKLFVHKHLTEYPLLLKDANGQDETYLIYLKRLFHELLLPIERQNNLWQAFSLKMRNTLAVVPFFSRLQGHSFILSPNEEINHLPVSLATAHFGAEKLLAPMLAEFLADAEILKGNVPQNHPLRRIISYAARSGNVIMIEQIKAIANEWFCLKEIIYGDLGKALFKAVLSGNSAVIDLIWQIIPIDQRQKILITKFTPFQAYDKQTYIDHFDTKYTRLTHKVTLLHAAVLTEYEAVVEKIDQCYTQCADQTDRWQGMYQESLFLAFALGTWQIARYLLKKHAYLANCIGAFQMTPLHWLAAIDFSKNPKAEIEQLQLANDFLQAGAQISAADRWGGTPFHYAATNGSPAMCKLFLQSDPDLACNKIEEIDILRSHNYPDKILIGRHVNIKDYCYTIFTRRTAENPQFLELLELYNKSSVTQTLYKIKELHHYINRYRLFDKLLLGEGLYSIFHIMLLILTLGIFFEYKSEKANADKLALTILLPIVLISTPILLVMLPFTTIGYLYYRYKTKMLEDKINQPVDPSMINDTDEVTAHEQDPLLSMEEGHVQGIEMQELLEKPVIPDKEETDAHGNPLPAQSSLAPTSSPQPFMFDAARPQLARTETTNQESAPKPLMEPISVTQDEERDVDLMQTWQRQQVG